MRKKFKTRQTNANKCQLSKRRIAKLGISRNGHLPCLRGVAVRAPKVIDALSMDHPWIIHREAPQALFLVWPPGILPKEFEHAASLVDTPSRPSNVPTTTIASNGSLPPLGGDPDLTRIANPYDPGAVADKALVSEFGFLELEFLLVGHCSISFVFMS